MKKFGFGKSGKFTFEELQEKDVKKCAEIFLKNVGDKMKSRFRSREFVERLIYGPNIITIVSKKNDKIAGLVCGSAAIPPNIAFLHVFDKEGVRAGLEGMLIDKFIETVKKKLPQASSVTATIPAESNIAVSFYSYKGFRVCGFIRGGEEQTDLVIMRKSI